MKLDDKINQWNKENHSKLLNNKKNELLCKCGHQNENGSIYCAECGIKLNWNDRENEQNIGSNSGIDAWIKTITIYSIILAVFNLLLGAWLGSGILIFFAVLIWTSRSYKAIYALGVVWLILAFFQFVIGSVYQYGLAGEVYSYQGAGLFFLSLINFGFGGWIIYKTQKFDQKDD